METPLKEPSNQAPGQVKFYILFAIYQLLWHIAIPWVLVRLWRKGDKEPGYREHIAERFGFYSPNSHFKADVWVHAVSMGETRAAVPLVENLLSQGKKVLISHMTSSGRASAAQIFASPIVHGRVRQVYLPYDFCWPVMRFLKHFQPQKGLLMETEVWPGLLAYAKSQKIPMYLVNGRLSDKSAINFHRFGSVSHFVFQLFQGIAAQSNLDKKHYQSFGVKNIQVTGNLKFDVRISNDLVQMGDLWKKTYWPNRLVIMAASTREGEDAIILQAIQKMTTNPKPLLLIVPRHLERVTEIEALAEQTQLSTFKRSELQLEHAVIADLVIGDTFGEMPAYYQSCDIVIMGGTLAGTGGQNLIEPCALGKPVILGPSRYNFAQVSTNALSTGAAIDLGKESEKATPSELSDLLAKHLDAIIVQPEKLLEMGKAGKEFTESHQGATKRTLDFIQSSKNALISAAKISGTSSGM